MNLTYILKFGALFVSIGLFTTFAFVTMNIEQEEIHKKAHQVEEPQEIIKEPAKPLIHEKTCDGIINSYEKQSMRKEEPTSLKEHYENCLTYGSPNPPKEVKKETKSKKAKPL